MKMIIAILIFVAKLYSWEINTHRAIDRRATESSINLSKFVQNAGIHDINYNDQKFEGYGNHTYISYIVSGETNGISQWNQTFADSKYQSLIEAGTILEDAQWPHGWVKEHISWWDRADGRFTKGV